MNRLLLSAALLTLAVTVNAPAQVGTAIAEGFVENQGQWDERARYLLRTPGLDFWIGRGEIMLDLQQVRRTPRGPRQLPRTTAQNPIVDATRHVVRMTFVGSDPLAVARGADRLAGTQSYMIGDRRHWALDVPRFGTAHIVDLYEGIEGRFSVDKGRARYDLVVAPGTEPRVVAVRFEGGEGLHRTSAGDLTIETSIGRIVHSRPKAYQIIGGEQRSVECDYVMQSDGTTRFAVGAYDHGHPLVIDPLIYSTFVAGTDLHIVGNMALDPAANICMVGSTIASDYPTTTGAYQTTNGKTDPARGIVFITKVNSTGTALLFSTYLGGAESNDNGFGIALDGSSNIYVTGMTNRDGTTMDFPITNGAYQSTHAGSTDVFVSKLNATGTALQYSTFIGGPGADAGYDLAIDRFGNAYLLAQSDSTFPTTTGAYLRTMAGEGDNVVVKFNSSGSALIYSTFIGGSGREAPASLGIDTSGNVYLAGQTESDDYPTTSGAFDRTQNNIFDGFVTKLNAAGSALVYSTYFGGPDGETAPIELVVDRHGNAVVTGLTSTDSMPTTAGAYAESWSGGYDAFLMKLNTTGSSLAYSTYLGGSDDDMGFGVALDRKGNPYVVGITFSVDFPMTLSAYDNSHNDENDVFVAKLNFGGTGFYYSTFIGGNSDDYGIGLGVDTVGNACIAGYTYSPDFPTTTGAYQRTNAYNAPFALQLPVPTLTLLSPIGGERWCTGSTETIRWTSSGIDSVGIALSADGGTSWTTLALRVPANTGSWGWAIPASWTAGSNYRVRIYNPSFIALADTSPSTFTINRVPSITLPPVSLTICQGERATFRVVAVGTELNYQWKHNGVNISGARDSVLVIPTVQSSDAGSYTVVIGGTCTPPATSIPATLTVNTSPIITTPPIGDTVCVGQSTTFRGTASGSGIGYQWLHNGAAIDGAVNASYTIPFVDTDDQGTYQLVARGTCAPPDTSGAAPLLVLPIPMITKQPTDTTLCAGGRVEFSVGATGIALTYQWRKDGIDVPGATDSILVLEGVTAEKSGSYVAIVTGGLCDATSSTAFLTVQKPPTITEQPTDVAVCLGQPGTLSIAVEGEGLLYQWRRDGVELPGETEPTLEFALVQPTDTGSYDVVISGTCDPPITSASARLSLATSTSINVTTQPSDTVVCQGTTLVLRVRATGASLNYQWRHNGADIPGARSSTFTLLTTALTDAGAYDVAIGSACGTPTTSQSAQVAVNAATTISEQPRDTSVHVGEAVTFTIVAAGTDISYQWTKNGETIPGATSHTLTIDPVTVADSGTYTVIITGRCGSATSRHAILALLPPASTPVTGRAESDVVGLVVVPHPATGITQLFVHTAHDLAREQHVGLYLYDLLGTRVLDLSNSFHEGGRRTASFNAGNLASGFYACRMVTSHGERVVGVVVVE